MKKFLLFICFVFPFSVFSQTGITWTSPIDVANNSHDNNSPRITLDGSGNPLILWGKTSTKNAYFSRWNGSMFTAAVTLNPITIPVFTYSWAGPDIASKGDTVYVVFKHTPEDTNNIYVVSSFDGGMNFSMPSRVDFIGDSACRFPTITVDNSGNPLVGFMKFNNMFMDARWVVAKSPDYGSTFSTDVKASGFSGGTVCDCCPGGIVASGNTVAMLYRDNLNNTRDMWAGVSTDGGNTFSNSVDVDDTDWVINACPSSAPDGVINGDSLYSIFMSGASGTSLVYYSRSSLTSFQGGTNKRLTGGLNSQNFPRIANVNETVAMIWRQTNGMNEEAAVSLTQDITSGISLPVDYDVIASGMNAVINVDVAIASGVIHAVWQDDASGTVKYRKGTFISTTGVAENNNETDFSIYPNPASDVVVIKFNAKEKITGNLQLTDVLGKLVWSSGEKTWNEGEVSELIKPESKLPQGVYFIKLISDKLNYCGKLAISQE